MGVVKFKCKTNLPALKFCQTIKITFLTKLFTVQREKMEAEQAGKVTLSGE